jgi:hypothetical protein
MIGPGKYDKLCTQVRGKARARGALLILLEGAKGSGFSCQLPPDLMFKAPEMLRHMADEIEKDQKATSN